MAEAPPEAISDFEARFERWRRRGALVLGPALGLAVWLGGGDSPAQRLAALMVFAAVWWLGEAVPLPVTALASTAGAVLLGVATPRDAFAAYGNPLLFLFVGSFMLAEAMKVHGLGERIAAALFRRVRTELGVLAAVSGAACAISWWMSNTAATAVLLPIAVAVARASERGGFRAAVVLSIAYGATVGGVATPVGTPPNGIGLAHLRGLAGVDMSFFHWMAFGVPMSIAMMATLWLLLAGRFGVGRTRMTVAAAPRRPFSRGETAVVVCFAIAVIGWLLPSAAGIVAPGSAAAAWLKTHLTDEVVALGAAVLLFLWPVGGRPALTWPEATRIDWGTILLFGGGILLGDLAGADKTGLAARWGEALVHATGASSLWGITALVTAGAIVLSELTSNTATATLMVPLAYALAQAAGVPPAPPMLGATIGASFGFALPVSTAPNAMAYGTGEVSIRRMASAGLLFDLLGFLLIVGGLRVLCPLLGLAP